MTNTASLDLQPMSLTASLGFKPPDYLDLYHAPFERKSILALRRERQARLFDSGLKSYQAAVASVQQVQASWLDISPDVITLGRADDLSEEQQKQFQQALQTFCPWKKGPFNFFGTFIDAEWRSDWKWARLLPHIQSLTDRKVADIGCHNGYFMFRMADQNPACVIGFEPVSKHFWNFQLIQNLVQDSRLTFELLGAEHLHLYPTFFDTIFCLGILYHHTDPVGLLRKMHRALVPQGEIVIDCQGIPGDQPIALTPRSRYARARGIWFLPTQSCLEHWLRRAGYTKIHCIFAEPLSIQEQRRTAWADVDSLAEFLDPHDSTLTVEGYPAPWRYYMIAQKR